MRRRVAATMSSRPTGIRKASIIREGGDPRISGQTLVPKKGLEPPHPCGYMDLNHARLPIPPLRLGTASAVASQGYLQRRSTSTILQTLARLSNQRSRDSAERQTAMVPTQEVTRLRSLTHDLSNSMETILQASYLLAQVELDPNS